MRHTGVSLFLAVGLSLGVSVTDSTAQDRTGGGGGFWEKMSGPGPWQYASGFVSVCLGGEKDPGSKLFCEPERGHLWLNLGGTYAWAGPEEGEELQSPSLKQWSFEPSVDMKAFTLFNYAPVLFGIGGGLHHFWGEDVGLTRGSMEARFGVIFLRVRSVHVGLRFARKIFFEGFTAADFGDPTGTFTTNGTDVVNTGYLYFSF
ncbi:MAG TPA: hypothetical protein VGC53_06765 [Vicinamibacteria bacterium]